MHVIRILLLLFVTSIPATRVHERRKRTSNKNDYCSRVFDVSNGTIIKTGESINNGARFLSSFQTDSREECEKRCCSAESCNVAVLEEKAISVGGDCFLFDCGSLDDFKCIFAVHSSYVTLGMIVNRGDLEKPRTREQSQHEKELKTLKTAPASRQQQQKNHVIATNAPMKETQNRERQQIPPTAIPWTGNEASRYEDTRQEDSKGKPTNRQDERQNSKDVMRQNGNLGVVPFGYTPRRQDQEERRPVVPAQPFNGKSIQYQQPSDQRGLGPSPLRASEDQESSPEKELHRKRPPLASIPDQGQQKFQEPKSLIRNNMPQRQRPPIYPDCTQFQWRCSSGDQCIGIYDRCNGIAQCNDGSDEQNCDQVPRSADDAVNSHGNADRANSPPVQSMQNGLSPSQYDPGVRKQQQHSSGGQYGPMKPQEDRQRGLPFEQKTVDKFQQQPMQRLPQTPPNQRDEFVPQRQPVVQHNQQSDSFTNGAKHVASPEKESRVEFISIHKVDSSAAGSGGERASLAVVMLGFGLVILAILLLFLSCRLRKMRRRLRRGKVLDTEEGEYLVNDMYL